MLVVFTRYANKQETLLTSELFAADVATLQPIKIGMEEFYLK